MWPSDSNFLLVDCVDADRGAARRGIGAGLIIRDPRSQPGLGSCLRISVGTPEQNDRLLRGIARRRRSGGMSAQRVLFIDRDGTLIDEPPDQQIDSLQKLRLVPGVIPALLRLRDAGYAFVMVSNQDGLGTASFPEPTFREPHEFLRELLASQGIRFEAEFICPHSPADDCACRKPKTGLLDDYLRAHPIDLQRSYVIGDRDTDLELARNLGIEAFACAPTHAGRDWPEIARG